MEAGLKNVDGAVEEYKRQNDLINLQTQFMGCVFGMDGWIDGYM